MSLVRGFETQVFVYSGSAWKKIPTIGDLSFTQNRTAIEVANRASNTKRVLSGMEEFNVSLTVQKGSDPTDTTNFDASAVLEAAYQNDQPLYFNFGGTLTNGAISGGRTECMICYEFSEDAPLDDLDTYTATLGISAKSATSSDTPSEVSNTTTDEDDEDED